MTDVELSARPRPRVAICVGVYSSASTWVFNVVSRLLVEGRPCGSALRLFADEISRDQEVIAGEAEFLILKSHKASPTVRVLAALSGIPVFVSVRDPRDAVVSLMERFDLSFQNASVMVKESCDTICNVPASGRILLLRYEDRFTSHNETIDAIASHLNIEIATSSRDAIFAEFTPDAVRAKITKLEEKGVFEDRPAVAAYDELTHWHPNHVGDGRVGKWAGSLTASQAANIGYSLATFFRRFGYARPSPIVPLGEIVSFNEKDVGANYLESGFSQIETNGIWTDGDKSVVRFEIPQHEASSFQFQLSCNLGPSLKSDNSSPSLQILIGSRLALTLKASSANPSSILLGVGVPLDALQSGRTVSLSFVFSGIQSPHEFGHSADKRQIGLFFNWMRLDAIGCPE